MLSNFKLGSDVKVEARSDSTGGPSLLESALYNMDVDIIYIDQSKGGAYSMNFRFKGKEDPNQTYRETIYFTNRNGEPTYNDKKDGSKRPLPGFTKVNEILLAICGKEMSDIETQKATIKVWQDGAEVNAQREVLVETRGLPVTLGIQKITTNKQVKSGDQYVDDPTGATRDFNEIHTAFRFEDTMSVAEIERGAEEAKFHTQWTTKLAGKTIDKVKKTSGGATAGAPPAAADAAPELVFD